MKLQLMREESLVINKELEPLWYGGINHVKFTGTANQMEVINLIKDTNKIRFIFQGSSSGNPAVPILADGPSICMTMIMRL